MSEYLLESWQCENTYKSSPLMEEAGEANRNTLLQLVTGYISNFYLVDQWVS